MYTVTAKWHCVYKFPRKRIGQLFEKQLKYVWKVFAFEIKHLKCKKKSIFSVFDPTSDTYSIVSRVVRCLRVETMWRGRVCLRRLPSWVLSSCGTSCTSMPPVTTVCAPSRRPRACVDVSPTTLHSSYPTLNAALWMSRPMSPVHTARCCSRNLY